jgi:hypothetical protein
MRSYIENRDGILWVENPANPGENYADCWLQYPELKEQFDLWLNEAGERTASALQQHNVQEMAKSLMPRFGSRAVRLAASKAFGEDILSERSGGSVSRVAIREPNKLYGK